MEFEYDADKSRVNKDKHGIDFEEAQALWLDVHACEIRVAIVENEPRFLIVGKIAEKYWTAVTTHRAAKIRIISVRRAREKEVEIYESFRIR